MRSVALRLFVLVAVRPTLRWTDLVLRAHRALVDRWRLPPGL